MTVGGRSPDARHRAARPAEVWAGFPHFDYVNPNAPRGGEARFAAIGSFDTFNPFNIKGEAAAGIGQLFETLLTDSKDEPFSEYGLIAESVDVADDRGSVDVHDSATGKVS